MNNVKIKGKLIAFSDNNVVIEISAYNVIMCNYKSLNDDIINTLDVYNNRLLYIEGHFLYGKIIIDKMELVNNE